MLVDALSTTFRALSFLALFQATGTSIFIALFGRQLVRNAVMAYGVFQGWGNDPAVFETGKNKELLDEDRAGCTRATVRIRSPARPSASTRSAA